MKATDLMIGDWVLTLESTHKKKVYAQIWAIEEGQTSILVKKDNCDWFVDIEWIEPISLTTKILKKNGFEKQWDGHFRYDNDDEDLTMAFYPKKMNCTKGSYNYIDIDKGCTRIQEMPIDYVHELRHALRLCEIEKEIEL